MLLPWDGGLAVGTLPGTVGGACARVVIEQAKGMLAEYLPTTVDEAFGLLRMHARDHNRGLTDVAPDVGQRKLPHDAMARRPGR